MNERESEKILWEAEFNPKVQTYWLLNGSLTLMLTVVGIVLLPFWLILGYYFTGRYLKRLRCVLTDRSLQVSKGMFVRVEKTVPLDKITDVGLVHGPIMRHFDLQALSIETAGQSSQGALIKLIGIVDTEGLRKAVLAQRDLVAATASGAGVAATPSPAADTSAGDELLAEIRDSLHRIESKLGDRTVG